MKQIKKYQKFDCTEHTFFRLSESQRKIYTCDRLKRILLEETPFLVGIQFNGNYVANTKNIKNKERILEAKGEMDYDYINDILFFKAKDREYDFSLEFQNLVIDIDKEKFIVGIQIFDASIFLGIDKIHLRTFPKWQFKARIYDGVIEIRLFCQIMIRNKIIEKNPIIIQQNTSNLPSSQMVATV